MDLDFSLTVYSKVGTFYSQSWHDEVRRGVDPVCGLHPVGAPHPGHAGIPVQVHIKFELPDEVK